MNQDKVLDVLAHIERSTSGGDGTVGHYQGDWVQVTECGTTACMAGWTTLLEGWTPLLYPAEGVFVGLAARDVKMTSDDCSRDGVTRDIEDLAQELLELTDAQASALFYGADDLASLYDEVSLILGIDRKVLVDKVQGLAAGMDAFRLGSVEAEVLV